MKIKNIYKSLLFCSIIILFSCGSQTNNEKVQDIIQEEIEKKYSDPIEYNNALVALQMRVRINQLELEEYMGNDINEIKRISKKLKDESKNVLSILKEISFEGGEDYDLKATLIKEIEFYECCYTSSEEFRVLEELLNLDDSMDTTSLDYALEAERLYNEYMSIIEPIMAQTDINTENFLLAQQQFANIYSLGTFEDNPLDERIESLEE